MGALSRHEDGTPVMTDGQLDALQHQHTLTRPEAENLFKRVAAGEDAATAAQAIKDARVTYRPAVEKIVNPTSNPLALADKRKDEEAKEQERAARKEESFDKHAPEAGPYGPGTPYTEVTEKAGNVTRKSDLPG